MQFWTAYFDKAAGKLSSYSVMCDPPRRILKLFLPMASANLELNCATHDDEDLIPARQEIV